MRKLLFILFISIGMMQYVNAQMVTGIVIGTDDDGALPGVTVRLKGSSSVGTITDLDGKYTLEVAGDMYLHTTGGANGFAWFQRLMPKP